MVFAESASIAGQHASPHTPPTPPQISPQEILIQLIKIMWAF